MASFEVMAKNVHLGPSRGFQKTEIRQKVLTWPKEPKFLIFSKALVPKWYDLSKVDLFIHL